MTSLLLTNTYITSFEREQKNAKDTKTFQQYFFRYVSRLTNNNREDKRKYRIFGNNHGYALLTK